MPPRKRARVSQAASPESTSQPKTPTSAASPPDNILEDVVLDPWTDDEEIGLFRGLMRWKPTGIHKHFHLISLHQFMLANGYTHPQNEHTRPAGIWRKLQTLYNLETLDEREDSRQLEKMNIPDEYRVVDPDDEDDSDDEYDDADVYSETENKIGNEDFDLAGEDFLERKWQRRLATEKQRRDESPPLLPDLNLAEQAPVEFTPSFSIEPEDVSTPAPRRGRPRASTVGPKGKPSGSNATVSTRRSARKAESAAEEEEEEEEEEDGDEEDEDEDEGEGEGEEGGEDENDAESEEEEETDDNQSTGRSTRQTKATRARTVEKPQTRTRSRK